MGNARGALAGGMSGAGAGAAFGPYGAAIGGGLGALTGFLSPDGSEDERRKRALIERALAELSGTNAEAGASNYGSNADFLGAMGGLRSEATSGGMTGSDRLAQEQSMNDAAAAAHMREGSILNSLASRGQAGGGAELAARLANSQGATVAQHDAGATAAAAARARALDALSGWGSMAGQQAGANDAISRFNASQRLSKAGMMAGLESGAAGMYGQDAQRERQQSAGTLQGLGNAANAGVDLYQQWQRRKNGQATPQRDGTT